MNSDKRGLLRVKAHLPDMRSLKFFSSKLTSLARNRVVQKYGKIIDLLNVPVQVEAITALAQFYDQPLRCFTFQDFQLAPTLEEFEQILDSPKKEKGPYRGIEQVVKIEELAPALNIPPSELVLHYKKVQQRCGEVHGFARGYLEKKAKEFLEAKKWESLEDILALLIFGLVLFPKLDNFIDTAAISVFWAAKVKEEDLVPALLADVYYTLHMRSEKGGGLMLCCLPLLYSWFMSHMPKDITEKDVHDWPQKLMALTEHSILWFPKKLGRNDVIINCGDFPNVPLIGTEGCINYNPMLAIRQLGYPMVEKPDDEVLKEVILQHMGANDPNMLQKIIQSWVKVHKKGNDLRKRKGETNEPYPHWVKERTKLIKLPFSIIPPTQHSSPAPVPVSIEEVDKFRTIIDRLESEKEALQHDIYQVNYERNELTFKLNERTKELKMAKKAIEDEERKRQKVAACLAGSTEEIKGRNQLLDQAWKEVDSVRGAWEQTLKGKNQLKEGYEARILSITASLQESQVVALNERRLRGIAEKKLQGLPNNWRELMKEMQDLKESEWRQKKEYEAISAQNQQLEAEVRHL
jgi:hypothetical protein